MHVLLPRTIRADVNCTGLPEVYLSDNPTVVDNPGNVWSYQTYGDNEMDWQTWAPLVFQKLEAGAYILLVPQPHLGETIPKLRGRVKSNVRHAPDNWKGLRISVKGELRFVGGAAGKLAGSVRGVKLYRKD